MQLSASDYSGLSNSELDNAYAAVYGTVQQSTGPDKLAATIELDAITQEILKRLGGFFGFGQGLLGGAKFPQYNAIQKTKPQGFVQSQVAQTAVVERAKEVGSSIKSYALGGAGMVGLLAVAYIIFAAGIGRKK